MTLYQINEQIQKAIELGFDPETGEILDASALEQLQDGDESFCGMAMCDATREDVVQPSIPREHLLANASVRNEQGIVVPKTVE